MPAGDFPFIVVEYDGRRIAIPRNEDYGETIESVRRAFSKLSTVRSNHIALTTTFLEFEPGPIEIGGDAWRDTLPLISTVKAVILPASPSMPKPTPSKRLLAGPFPFPFPMPIDIDDLMNRTDLAAKAIISNASSKRLKRPRVASQTDLSVDELLTSVDNALSRLETP